MQVTRKASTLNSFMKKLLLTATLALFIAGCGLLPPKFDNNEYELLSRLEATALIMNENCGNNEFVESMIPTLEYDARVLHTYAFYTPKNTEVYEIADILKNDVTEFKEQYEEDKASRTYCVLKTELFLEKVRTTLEVVAEKPRR